MPLHLEGGHNVTFVLPNSNEAHQWFPEGEGGPWGPNWDYEGLLVSVSAEKGQFQQQTETITKIKSF